MLFFLHNIAAHFEAVYYNETDADSAAILNSLQAVSSLLGERVGFLVAKVSPDESPDANKYLEEQNANRGGRLKIPDARTSKALESFRRKEQVARLNAHAKASASSHTKAAEKKPPARPTRPPAKPDPKGKGPAPE